MASRPCRLQTMLGAMLRILVPVMMMIGTYGLSYFAYAIPLSAFDDQALLGQAGLFPSHWLSAGHITIMIAFFIVMMMNRLFGPAYALLITVLSWSAVAAFVYFGWPSCAPALSLPAQAPQWPTAMPFVIALGTAHLAGIIVFDALRGRPWWRAPLIGSLTAAVVLPVLDWIVGRSQDSFLISSVTLDLVIKVATALILVVAYGFLRPLARPRSGFGGY